MSQLTVLGFTLPDVRMNITDLGHDIDGLLGMDFLSDSNFEIRPAERGILVEKLPR